MEFLSQRPYYTHGPLSGPFHTGAYIQSGGNVFKWLGNMARSVFFPYVQQAVKKVAKSDTIKNLAKGAKDAAVSGAIDAGSKILKGENVKESIFSSGKKAGQKLKRTLGKEVNKVGQQIVTATEPLAKKKKENAKQYSQSKSSKQTFVRTRQKERETAR